MAELSSETIAAGCVALGGKGVLIEAKTDDCRTDLLLRLIDRGATLVSDARTICRRHDKALVASPPADTAGRIEVRGIGTVERAHFEQAPVALLIVALDAAPRMPEERRVRRIAGIDVPVLALGPLDPAAPIKAELALKAFA